MDYKHTKQTIQKKDLYPEDTKEETTPIIQSMVIEAGKEIKCSYMEYSMLIFVLEGQFTINSICAESENLVNSESMLFMPQGRTFYLKFTKKSTLLSCNIPTCIELFKKNPLAIYGKHIKNIPEKLQKSEFCILPIHPILLEEVEHVVRVLPKFTDSIYFQTHKRDTFIIYIKNLYQPEEIAFFIQTMLTEDIHFLAKVLDIYHDDITAQEIIDKSGMSTSTFNRKFKRTFGINIGHWLLKKKSRVILDDIVSGKFAMHEIAEKHQITPNHLTKFCKLHFHQSPTDIRENHIHKQKETRILPHI